MRAKTKSQKAAGLTIFLLVLAIAAISIFIGYLFYTNLKDKPYRDAANANLAALEAEIAKVNAQDIVPLNELTPFEWDTFYIFDPYITDYETFSTTVGGNTRGLEFVSGNTNLSAFYKDGMPICGIFGDGFADGGYTFAVDWEKDEEYKIIHPEDNCEFIVEKYNDGGRRSTWLQLLSDN